MDERIVKFIAALRASGIRVSLAESEDAFSAIHHLGVKNREVFRLSLRSTLVKKADELATFEELFPIFFSSSEIPPMLNIAQDLSSEEAQQLAEALKQFSQQIRNMIERMTKGEQLTQQELEKLARMVGLNQLDNLRYKEWMIERMKRALHFKEIQEALQELVEQLEELGMNRERAERLSQFLVQNQQALEDQLRQFAGERLTDNMSERPLQESIESLLNRPFSSLSEGDMQRLRKEVQRLAAVLKTRIALRQKRSKAGQLDPKATIRANLKHGNVPIEIKHRDKHLKPKLVVICDVSTSMRFCSELMLSLLYQLQDQISKTSSFAFIDHLEYISPDLSGNDSNTAISKVLERLPSGYYNTDFGNSLKDFQNDFIHTIDNRTAFIIVGDGRNNYNNPRIDIFKQLANRSQRTIWITPEAAALWGSGDSDMLQYAQNCNIVLQASNMSQLTSAIDKLLTI
jgi:uncharacterized protein with von Willebrand factor type A (vWA) domain